MPFVIGTLKVEFTMIVLEDDFLFKITSPSEG
jgi:hypothetical protein